MAVSNYTDVKTIVDMAVIGNQYTGGVIGVGIPLSFFFVILFIFMKYLPPWRAATISSFISVLFSIFLVALAVSPPWIFVLFSVILIASIFMGRKVSPYG